MVVRVKRPLTGGKTNIPEVSPMMSSLHYRMQFERVQACLVYLPSYSERNVRSLRL
jgi:hypothetical protein